MTRMDIPVIELAHPMPGFPDDARFALVRLDDDGVLHGFRSLDSEDLQFVEALKRHRPNVFVGAIAEFKQADGRKMSIVPAPLFRPHANIVSLTGFEGPLGLSTKFPGQSMVEGKAIRSLSAVTA